MSKIVRDKQFICCQLFQLQLLNVNAVLYERIVAEAAQKVSALISRQWPLVCSTILGYSSLKTTRGHTRIIGNAGIFGGVRTSPSMIDGCQ